MTGGKSGDTGLQSTELYGSKSISLPDLPSPRHGHVAFISADGHLAVCGGHTQGNYTPSCLVLDPLQEADSPRTWRHDVIHNLTEARHGSSAVTISIGTYVLGGAGSHQGHSSEVLLAGSKQWVTGPTLPKRFYDGCALPLPPNSFLIVHGDEIREFDSRLANSTSDLGWLPVHKWPRLKAEAFSGGGCAIIGQRLVVVGGVYGNNKVEVIDIDSRVQVDGPPMQQGRAYFSLALVGAGASATLLALGGKVSSDQGGKYSSVQSVEEYFTFSNTWKRSEDLAEARHHFGTVSLPAQLRCVADFPTISNGDIDCFGETYMPVGTSCAVNCTQEHGYHLENDDTTSVVCGWGSTWLTEAKCGKKNFLYN